MSKENVDLTRSAYDTARGDLDAHLEFFSLDMDYRAIEGAVDDVGVLYGREAYRKYCEDWIKTFDEFSMQPEEIIDAGDQVVVVVHIKGRMKGSHSDVDMRLGLVWTVRDGKIVRGREYATRNQAIEATGLSASAAGRKACA
jgi:ketosteroid isomerase-like protein